MSYTIERNVIYQNDKAYAWHSTSNGAFIGNAAFAGDARNSYGNRYNYETGLRFRKLYIPSDATDITASLTFMNATGYIDTVVNTRIYAQKSAHAKSFPLYTPIPGAGYGLMYDDYIARERMPNPIDWDGIDAGGNLESPDIGSLIQALVTEFGGLYYATIVLFWGDIDGRTPVPPAGTSNLIDCRGTVTLSIAFSSEIGIPVRPERNIFDLTETDVQDFTYGLDDVEIRNDVRYLIPHHRYELDVTQSPPVDVPVDFMHLESDALSDQKYGRRTQIMKYHIPNDFGGVATCKANLEKAKEPLLQAKVTIAGENTDNIEKCLKARLSDICQVDIDFLDEDFWVDGITLSAGVVPEMTMALSQKRSSQSLKIARFDVDVFDGTGVFG